LTIIVSEPILDFDGVFEDEFLPDPGFFRCKNPEDCEPDCESGPLSRSAGRGDKSGGRSRGLLKLDFEGFLESIGFAVGVAFRDWGESCKCRACSF
jgi:hypothetical protein